MHAEEPTLEQLVHRVLDLLRDGKRGILGIAGAPGAGKTTFSTSLSDRIEERVPGGLVGDGVVRVPMDGFHLADAELARLGRSNRKGAADTFDVAGYVSLLERLAADRDEIVYAPSFDRILEQPVAGSIPVPPSARLIITEGNYLLLETDGWDRVGPLLNEAWYLHLSDPERHRRLVTRHTHFGKSEAAAHSWTYGSDQDNADLVAGTAHRADLIVNGDVFGPPESGEPRHVAIVPIDTQAITPR